MEKACSIAAGEKPVKSKLTNLQRTDTQSCCSHCMVGVLGPARVWLSHRLIITLTFLWIHMDIPCERVCWRHIYVGLGQQGMIQSIYRVYTPTTNHRRPATKLYRLHHDRHI